MDVTSYAVGSCAASNICNLGYSKDAVSAMMTFCSKELGGSGGFGAKSFGTLTPYYIFVAGPEVAGQGHSKAWVRYGTEFAAFIVENGLGTVATLGPHLNVRYHPTTTCQIWIWHPDQKGMEKWYKEQSKPKPKVEAGGD